MGMWLSFHHHRVGFHPVVVPVVYIFLSSIGRPLNRGGLLIEVKVYGKSHHWDMTKRSLNSVEIKMYGKATIGT